MDLMTLAKTGTNLPEKWLGAKHVSMFGIVSPAS